MNRRDVAGFAVFVRAPRGRTLLALGIGCWSALVGPTRVYLRVHWFTDVLGGRLFGVGRLGSCLAAAARWLPEKVTAGAGETAREHAPGAVTAREQAAATGTAQGHAPAFGTTREQVEDHAPQDPGRRGRSRLA